MKETVKNFKNLWPFLKDHKFRLFMILFLNLLNIIISVLLATLYINDIGCINGSNIRCKINNNYTTIIVMIKLAFFIFYVTLDFLFKDENHFILERLEYIDENLDELKAGDVVYLTGNILTARDQAHKRLLERGAPLDIEGAVLFHAGPIIAQEDGEYKMVAIGPTTSMRMNPYQSDVLDMGPKIVIGKGGMDDNVREALIRNKALYVVATGGCAALYVDAVEEIESVDWLDLGMPEAMWNLKVKDFGQLIVARDSEGNSLYD